MPQSFGSLQTHLVFSTKGREQWILPEFAQRLYDYIGGTLRGNKCSLLAAGGTERHLDARLARQHLAEPRQHDLVVIDDGYPQHDHSFPPPTRAALKMNQMNQRKKIVVWKIVKSVLA